MYYLEERKNREDRIAIKSEAEARFAEEDERQIREDIHAVLSTAAGRRLYVSMLHHGALFKFTNKDDNHAYVCGKRDAALEVWKVVTYRESALANLAQKERDEIRDARNKKIRELMSATAKEEMK